jgi:hypothetical protein
MLKSTSKTLLFTAVLCFLAASLGIAGVNAQQSASKVEIVKTPAGNYQLLRNGQPFYIKGAGCDGTFGQLAAFGANSSRGWHFNDSTRALLDEAHEKGLALTVGIWLNHERHGMDYQDYDAVTKQIDMVMKAIRELKDHPAVLIWGIGNEMEGEGSNPAIWSHIEHIAQLVKAEDPNHPVMTVIAEIGGRKVEAIHKLCPSVDIIGINSYGGAPSLPDRYAKLNGKKPYIVTEFGPVGTWEVPKNNIDAILEPLSHDKAAYYAKSYRAFEADAKHCLGSYAFLWGHKQEATATWFGMFLPNGKRTAAVDTMSELWTGKKPANVCPQIRSLALEGSNEVDGDQVVKLRLDAFDPEGDPINVQWVMTGESSNYVTGGDFQESPPSFSDAVLRSDETSAELKMPASSGLYRIYAYVDDGEANGGGAVANVPIRVRSQVETKPGTQVDLPFVVFDEPGVKLPYVPSGFMGSTDNLKLALDSRDDPKQGAHCIKVTYDRGDAWAGVAWQSPENDWGDVDGGFDLTGAKKMTFWARSATGTEKITFGVGLIGRDKPFFDTTKKEIAVNLTPQWKQYTIDLSNADLKRIKSGFFFSLAGQGKPITFYLDDLKFIDDENMTDGAKADTPNRTAGPLKTEPVSNAKLPFTLFDEPIAKLPYVPSGFMGSTDNLKLALDSRDDPKQGAHCIKVTYDRGDAWAGVAWQSPENDWGDVDGGFDLTGAKKMTFWARSATGTEKITFGVGLIGRDKPFFDTTKKEIAVNLTPQWKQYTIDLSNADLKRIKSGFFFSLAGQGKPITFYLDDLKFE